MRGQDIKMRRCDSFKIRDVLCERYNANGIMSGDRV